MKKTLALLAPALLLLVFTTIKGQEKSKVVQINLSNVLNARSVTTLTNGKLTTWTKGIDGNGEADGYLTHSASLFMGDINPKALPDDPLFPANEKHPEVLLHYSNSDSSSNQTVALTNAGNVHFDVPSDNYTALFLAFTSAEGASQIKVNLIYANGTETKAFEVPDYYLDIPAENTDWCYLAHDLAKWGKNNNMTEKDHHNIDLLTIHPDPNRQLTGIQMEKTEAGYLVFWAATGIIK
jgi:hypothetical protein